MSRKITDLADSFRAYGKQYRKTAAGDGMLMIGSNGGKRKVPKKKFEKGKKVKKNPLETKYNPHTELGYAPYTQEESEVISRGFFVVFQGDPDFQLSIMPKILIPDFSKDHNGPLLLSQGIARDMDNAMKEIQYLQNAFIRLKRDPKSTVDTTILFSNQLRDIMYETWFKQTVLPITIDGQKYDGEGFTRREINDMKFIRQNISLEQGQNTDWYTKFLADVYLHWFLSRQSRDIWKQLHSGETLPDITNANNRNYWPGVHDSIKEKRWMIDDQAGVYNQPLPGARNWRDPRYSAKLRLPGLKAWSDNKYSEGNYRSDKRIIAVWNYPVVMPRRDTKAEVLDAKVRTSAIKLAFKSLRVATLIRLPTVTWEDSMFYNRASSSSTKQAPYDTVVHLLSRGPAYVLFDKPLLITNSGMSSVSHKHHHWIGGGGSLSYPTELSLTNIRFASRLNAGQAIGRIISKNYVPKWSYNRQVILREVSLITPSLKPQEDFLTIFVDADIPGSKVSIKSESYKQARLTVYGGINVRYPMLRSKNDTEVMITEIKFKWLN